MMMTIMLVAHRNYRHVMLAIFSTTFLLLLSVDEVRALIAIPPTASPVIHYRHLDRVGGSSSRNVAIKNNFGIHNNHHPSWSSSYSTTKTTRTTSLAAGVMMSTSTAAASTTATYYTRLLLMTTLQQLRGGEVSDLAMNAYEWCHNLSSPAALIAGAVVATIYENMGSGALDINASKDSKWVIFGKRCCRLLLLSAFACEVLSIFITTVTGTMLLSHTEASLDAYNLNKMVSKYTTPLSFLHDNFEFEYLTARITFLQGLLNWLGAIALGHILPSGESTDSRVMNQFIGASLLLLMVIMLSFYNNHMNFYSNYAHMLSRWYYVCWKKFIWTWPPRPSIVCSIPLLGWIFRLGYLAFSTQCQSQQQAEKQEENSNGGVKNQKSANF